MNKIISKPWKSMAILGESSWQIDICIGTHMSEQRAKDAAQEDMMARFFLHNGKPSIMITTLKSGGEPHHRFFFDQDVVITEVNAEKLQSMGRPLDMDSESDMKTAVEALLNHDPSYTISEEDMVPSKMTLKDFIQRYGDGYRVDWIAWGACQID